MIVEVSFSDPTYILEMVDSSDHTTTISFTFLASKHNEGSKKIRKMKSTCSQV